MCSSCESLLPRSGLDFRTVAQRGGQARRAWRPPRMAGAGACRARPGRQRVQSRASRSRHHARQPHRGQRQARRRAGGAPRRARGTRERARRARASGAVATVAPRLRGAPARPCRRRRAAPPSRVRTRTRRARTRRPAAGADSSTGSTCAREADTEPHGRAPSIELLAEPRLTSAPHVLGREVARVTFGAVARCGTDRRDRPKVAEFQLPPRIDEDVARLDVAVDVTARVNVHECVADVAQPAHETR